MVTPRLTFGAGFADPGVRNLSLDIWQFGTRTRNLGWHLALVFFFFFCVVLGNPSALQRITTITNQTWSLFRQYWCWVHMFCLPIRGCCWPNSVLRSEHDWLISRVVCRSITRFVLGHRRSCGLGDVGCEIVFKEMKSFCLFVTSNIVLSYFANLDKKNISPISNFRLV